MQGAEPNDKSYCVGGSTVVVAVKINQNPGLPQILTCTKDSFAASYHVNTTKTEKSYTQLAAYGRILSFGCIMCHSRSLYQKCALCACSETWQSPTSTLLSCSKTALGSCSPLCETLSDTCHNIHIPISAYYSLYMP